MGMGGARRMTLRGESVMPSSPPQRRLQRRSRGVAVACQGQTASGNPCPLPGEPDSLLCRHQHDPRWSAERSERNREAALTRNEPSLRVVKWGSTLAWPTPERLGDSLAEAAGFVAAKAMTPNQGQAIRKLAEVAAKVRGWRDGQT